MNSVTGSSAAMGSIALRRAFLGGFWCLCTAKFYISLITWLQSHFFTPQAKHSLV